MYHQYADTNNKSYYLPDYLLRKLRRKQLSHSDAQIFSFQQMLTVKKLFIYFKL